MSNELLLFPSLTNELLKRMRFQKTGFDFFYIDKHDQEQPLNDEPTQAMSSVYCIKDDNGEWDQDRNNFGVRRHYLLRSFQCLFGEDGIACKNAVLGMAVIWTSPDSKQRGVIPVGTFTMNDQVMEATAEMVFQRAQLRGQVDFTTVLYLAAAGVPEETESHLANKPGCILGELETYSVRLDGTGSTFPIFEVSAPGQPLWYVKCDWIDPTQDSFTECVSINLNTAHKNYRFIDRKQATYNSQLLAEVIAGALSVIVEKVRLQTAYWDQIMNNDGLGEGSVGQAIYYFSDALEWNLSTPESVSLCARKYFDQRM